MASRFISRFSFMVCLVVLAGTMSLAGDLAAPELQETQSWLIQVRQYNLNSPQPVLGPASHYRYTVADLMVRIDGVEAYRIDIHRESEGLSATASLFYGSLYIGRKNHRVLRFSKGDLRLEVAPLAEGHFDPAVDSPFFGEYSAAPISLPNFAQTRASQTYSYVPALRGWGFPVNVTQSQRAYGEGVRVTLQQGPRTVVQDWSAKLPWWTRAEEPHVFVAELVSFQPARAGKRTSGTSESLRSGIDPRTSKHLWAPASGRAANNANFAESLSKANVAAANGESEKPMWSGYWWQSTSNPDIVLPETVNDPDQRTYADGGMLEKYDDYLAAEYPDYNPSTTAKQWELDHYSHPNGEAWFGHCNGWAAASILFPEPLHNVTAHGITFDVGDIKGLLSEMGYDVRLNYWLGRRYGMGNTDLEDPRPYDVHRSIINNIGVRRIALVADIDREIQVWNYPVYKYELSQEDAGEGRVRFDLEVWYCDAGVAAEFIGLKSRILNWSYTLEVDENGDVVEGDGGAWITNERNPKQTNPDFLWGPDSVTDGRNRYHNPALFMSVVTKILESVPAAKAVTVDGAAVEGDIVNGGDGDWFTFTIGAAGTYTLRTELNTNPDTYLYLFDSMDPLNRNLLGENDDIVAGQVRNSELTRALEAGTYYVLVRGYDVNQLGSYSLTVKDASGGQQRDFFESTEEVAIPDEGQVTSELPVERSGRSGIVRIAFRVDHELPSSVTVKAESPNGAYVILHNGRDSFYDGYWRVNYADIAAEGAWILTVTDDAADGKSGRILGWSLQFEE
ncbi:DVUA0089 family protein [Sulfidibacter corallicola]